MEWSAKLNSPVAVHFSQLIPKMSVFSLVISCSISSNLPWFVGLTFQVPMQYCSLQHWTLLSPPVQVSSVTPLCPILCNPMNRSTPGLPVHHQLPEFTQTHIHPVGDAIQPSHPMLSLLLLPSIFPRIRVFLMSQLFASGGPKYCSFSFNISPSNENPGLISFRMDWLDLLAI